MKEELRNHINNPKELEKLYRKDKSAFKQAFQVLYPEMENNMILQVWYQRLNYETSGLSFGSRLDLLFVIVASVVAGIIAKIPMYTEIDPDFFYPRNLGFIVFPLLILYFAKKQTQNVTKLLVISIASIISVLYINLLPNTESDTTILACIHLPLFLWVILGYTFVGEQVNDFKKRFDFLRFNGDLIIMTGLILITGALLTGITLGLFSLINLRIHDFYFEYIVIGGAFASPIVGAYLVYTNPQLVNKVSPVIAKVFTPLVLITLLAYLIAIVYTGKDPYRDRDFLFFFNLLLVAVMAIILFSVAETSKQNKSKAVFIMLFLLSVLTIIVNGIALSAIVFRISEWGITPNRLTVLGGNLLMLTNLLMVAVNLFKASKYPQKIELVEKNIAQFLPVYSIWTMVVLFLFPLLFGFK